MHCLRHPVSLRCDKKLASSSSLPVLLVPLVGSALARPPRVLIVFVVLWSSLQINVQSKLIEANHPLIVLSKWLANNPIDLPLVPLLFDILGCWIPHCVRSGTQPRLYDRYFWHLTRFTLRIAPYLPTELTLASARIFYSDLLQHFQDWVPISEGKKTIH